MICYEVKVKGQPKILSEEEYDGGLFKFAMDLQRNEEITAEELLSAVESFADAELDGPFLRYEIRSNCSGPVVADYYDYIQERIQWEDEMPENGIRIPIMDNSHYKAEFGTLTL